MTKLYASHSSEFFAVREPGRLYIYRDSFLDMTHRVADHMAGDLIHLADNGDAFFRSKDGLFRLRREKGVRAERCKAVATLDGSSEGGVLRGFTVRADGEQVAYEQVVPAQKFSSKLKRFLGQKSAQGDIGPSLHRFVVSGWSGRSSSCYFETVVDPRTSAGIVWWTAADFGFLAVLERERDGRSVLRLIDVLDESVVNELVVDGKLSRDRFMTLNGTVGFGLEKEGRRAFLIWTYSQDRFQIAYPKDSRVMHLTKDRVIFLNRTDHRLTVKTFKNEVVTEVSLSALARLGVEYLVNFNPRGSIELVTYHNGKLRVHHTDIDQLPTDAKRWELVGERQRAERLEEYTDGVLERENEQRDSHHLDQQRQQLAQDFEVAQTANNYEMTPSAAPPRPLDLEILAPVERAPRVSAVEAMPVERAPQMPPPAPAQPDEPEPYFENAEEAREALERLRMSYIAGDVSREDYYTMKAALERALGKLSGGPSVPQAPPPADGFPRTLSLSSE